MPKFRKKPVVIEAFQYFDDLGEDTNIIPVWLITAVTDGTLFVRAGESFIKTLEGDMLVRDGDWIIRGVQDELYPCKADIFAATYEEVLDA